MHPLLFKIGPIPVHTYGFMIALGFLSALYIFRRNAEREKLNVDRVLDLAFWGLLVAFIGCRILFVFTRLDYFMADPLAVFRIWEGGLVFYGGPLASFPFCYWYLKKHRMPIWKTMDAMIPGIALAHSFGRLGCLSAGCCYGKPTGSSFGIRLYSDLVDKQYQGIPLHPTQLYESTALLLLFCGLQFLQRRKTFDGQIILTYFMAYPVIRSVVEIFRGDLIRGFVIDGILSTSQFISILVFLAAMSVLILKSRKLRMATS